MMRLNLFEIFWVKKMGVELFHRQNLVGAVA